MKIIKVEKCLDCPYGKRELIFKSKVFECRWHHRRVENPEDIPDWCPLENRYEQ